MSENYDFVLVGGGVAGLYLAVHLGKKFRVLVLESGDKEASDDVQELSAGSVYSSYENNYFPHALPETYRFRGLGGAGNLWGGACSTK